MRKLKLEPIQIDEHNWYYEEPRGVLFVHEVVDANGNFYRTDQIVIPWKKLAASVCRKYDAELKAKKKARPA